MCHIELLRFVDILQKRTRGRHRRRPLAQTGGIEIGQVKLLTHSCRAGHKFIVFAAHFEHTAQPLGGKLGHTLGFGGRLVHDKLPRLEAAQLVKYVVYRVVVKGRNAKLARGHIAERNAAVARLVKHRAQVIASALLEHGGVRDRAGGYYADNIALYKPLCRCRIFDLLADGDLVALGNKPCYVALCAVIRNSAHGCAQLGVCHCPVPRRQRKVKLL